MLSQSLSNAAFLCRRQCVNYVPHIKEQSLAHSTILQRSVKWTALLRVEPQFDKNCPANNNFVFHLRWEELPPMNTPRYFFGLEWIPDGPLFAVGGLSVDREPTSTVEMLECSWEAREGPATSKWRYVAPLLAPRAMHGVRFFAGRLFAVGGKNDSTVECFALPSAGNEMGEWTRVRPLNRETKLIGVLPFGESLLCVGK